MYVFVSTLGSYVLGRYKLLLLLFASSGFYEGPSEENGKGTASVRQVGVFLFSFFLSLRKCWRML